MCAVVSQAMCFSSSTSTSSPPMQLYMSLPLLGTNLFAEWQGLALCSHASPGVPISQETSFFTQRISSGNKWTQRFYYFYSQTNEFPVTNPRTSLMETEPNFLTKLVYFVCRYLYSYTHICEPVIYRYTFSSYNSQSSRHRRRLGNYSSLSSFKTQAQNKGLFYGLIKLHQYLEYSEIRY